MYDSQIPMTMLVWGTQNGLLPGKSTHTHTPMTSHPNANTRVQKGIDIPNNFSQKIS